MKAVGSVAVGEAPARDLPARDLPARVRPARSSSSAAAAAVAGGAGKDAHVVRGLAVTGATILRVRSFKGLVAQRVWAEPTPRAPPQVDGARPKRREVVAAGVRLAATVVMAAVSCATSVASSQSMRRRRVLI